MYEGTKKKCITFNENDKINLYEAFGGLFMVTGLRINFETF